jgi:hypothetical protein
MRSFILYSASLPRTTAYDKTIDPHPQFYLQQIRWVCRMTISIDDSGFTLGHLQQ